MTCWCRGRTCSSTATSRRPTTSSRAPAFSRARSLHGCTRLAVKLDFITGLLIKATEIDRHRRGFRGVEANLGEVIAWRNAMWALVGCDGAHRRSLDRRLCPARRRAGAAYHVLAPEAYVQIKT